jgi:hypothetical protein
MTLEELSPAPDLPETGSQRTPRAEERAAQYVTKSPDAWPFHTVTPTQWHQLTAEAKAEAEGFVRGLCAASRKQRAA